MKFSRAFQALGEKRTEKTRDRLRRHSQEEGEQGPAGR
jgi:hypothetical protein